MDASILVAAYVDLTKSTYAKANPGEMTRIKAYVDAIASGSQNPTPPLLATWNGKAFVGMLHAMMMPTLSVHVVGSPIAGAKLTAAIQ